MADCVLDYPLTSEKEKWVVWFLSWEVNCILEKDKNEKLFSDGFVSWHYKFFEDSCHKSLWEFEKYIFIKLAAENTIKNV